MTPLQFSKERIHSILLEIAQLKDLDFPYRDSRDALDVLGQRLQQRFNLLASLSDKNDPSVVKAACSESLLEAFRHLPLLGFILRSTDVRNSFEVVGPLSRLARKMLGKNTKLVLSSEWQFSPHIIYKIPEIPQFVLLGLPASESGNPLLIPLAGHEFGHTAWHQRSFQAVFSPLIQKRISETLKRKETEYTTIFGGSANDLFMTKNVSPAHTFALKQTEETFCDCLGLRLFAEAYYLAFVYLMAPGVSVQRSPGYPSTKRRISNLEQAATKFRMVLPSDIAGWFVDESEPTDTKMAFLLSLADDASQSLLTEIIDKVADIAKETVVPSKSVDKMDRVQQAFRLVTPATDIGDLVNILNAGWQAYLDPTLWTDLAHVNKDEALRELLLKSIEILEIEERLKNTGASS
jgi:hypothetical protein